MDSLTQEQFTKILTHECRYDKVVRPAMDGALNVSVQIDLKHIEAVEQLVSRKNNESSIQCCSVLPKNLK